MNIDLAPTFADLGGGQDAELRERAVTGIRAARQEARPRTQERARRALRRESPGPAAKERGAAAQQDPDNDANPPNSGTPATGSQAPAVRRGQFQPLGLPEYAALRTDRYTYVEYVTGERQLYDLRADPDQLHNIVSTADPKLVQDLAKRLSALKKCKGSGCRVADRG